MHATATTQRRGLLNISEILLLLWQTVLNANILPAFPGKKRMAMTGMSVPGSAMPTAAGIDPVIS
jgi:hypothetical protein